MLIIFWRLRSKLQFLILIDWLTQRMQLMLLSYGKEHVPGFVWFLCCLSLLFFYTQPQRYRRTINQIKTDKKRPSKKSYKSRHMLFATRQTHKLRPLCQPIDENKKLQFRTQPPKRK
jgi:hypothetical protein